MGDLHGVRGEAIGRLPLRRGRRAPGPRCGRRATPARGRQRGGNCRRSNPGRPGTGTAPRRRPSRRSRGPRRCRLRRRSTRPRSDAVALYRAVPCRGWRELRSLDRRHGSDRTPREPVHVSDCRCGIADTRGAAAHTSSGQAVGPTRRRADAGMDAPVDGPGGLDAAPRTLVDRPGGRRRTISAVADVTGARLRHGASQFSGLDAWRKAMHARPRGIGGPRARSVRSWRATRTVSRPSAGNRERTSWTRRPSRHRRGSWRTTRLRSPRLRSPPPSAPRLVLSGKLTRDKSRGLASRISRSQQPTGRSRSAARPSRSSSGTPGSVSTSSRIRSGSPCRHPATSKPR